MSEIDAPVGPHSSPILAHEALGKALLARYYVVDEAHPSPSPKGRFPINPDSNFSLILSFIAANLGRRAVAKSVEVEVSRWG